MLHASKYHIQATIGASETGKRQVRFTKLLAPFVGRCSISEVGLTAHQLGQTVKGWTPFINHTEFVRVVLYWTPIFPSEKDLLAIENWLWHYIKNSVLNDENNRATILKSLKGTGWYFDSELIK